MAATDERLRLGVSACLLGRKVRYDGGHKRDDFVSDTLGAHVEWVEVCPELELGLGVPRPSLHLEGRVDAPSMVVTSTGEDLSESMRRFSSARVKALESMELDGYVLKSKSPSCGFERVPVFRPGRAGVPAKAGRGLFAEALVERMPMLPVEEEGRLRDPALRENFIERIFAYRRWRLFRASSPKAKDLVAFHTAHKLALSAHDPVTYRKLGRIAADAGKSLTRATLDDYGALFMAALSAIATRKKHADVLFHLIGHLKREVDADDRAELVATIESYRLGRVPLVVPITLLKHHFRRHPSEWVTQQTYLDPYPAELMLRNHV